MNTIHDEVKIRELFNDDRSWSDNMKEYAEYIRNKTIDECIACVPEKVNDLVPTGLNGVVMKRPTTQPLSGRKAKLILEDGTELNVVVE